MGGRLGRRNPGAESRTAPLDDADSRQRATSSTVPAGTAEPIRERLAAASPNELNALQWHVVKRGETLATIARKLRVNRTDLAEANYLRVASRSAGGTKLLIPRMPSAALLARAASGDAVESAETRKADTTMTESAVDEETTRVTYRVRAGDTLFAIAKRHGTTVESLKTLNNMRSTALRVGARLVVQTTRAANTQQQQ